MDETQAYMILEHIDLADACADRSTALLEIITDALPQDNFGRRRGNGCKDIPQLKDNILQMRGSSLEEFFNMTQWKHRNLTYRVF